VCCNNCRHITHVSPQNEVLMALGRALRKYSVVQCVTVCFSVLQRVEVCGSA